MRYCNYRAPPDLDVEIQNLRAKKVGFFYFYLITLSYSPITLGFKCLYIYSFIVRF
jgi:hypothetical protein